MVQLLQSQRTYADDVKFVLWQTNTDSRPAAKTSLQLAEKYEDQPLAPKPNNEI